MWFADGVLAVLIITVLSPRPLHHFPSEPRRWQQKAGGLYLIVATLLQYVLYITVQ